MRALVRACGSGHSFPRVESKHCALETRGWSFIIFRGGLLEDAGGGGRGAAIAEKKDSSRNQDSVF